MQPQPARSAPEVQRVEVCADDGAGALRLRLVVLSLVLASAGFISMPGPVRADEFDSVKQLVNDKAHERPVARSLSNAVRAHLLRDWPLDALRDPQRLQFYALAASHLGIPERIVASAKRAVAMGVKLDLRASVWGEGAAAAISRAMLGTWLDHSDDWPAGVAAMSQPDEAELQRRFDALIADTLDLMACESLEASSVEAEQVCDRILALEEFGNVPPRLVRAIEPKVFQFVTSVEPEEGPLPYKLAGGMSIMLLGVCAEDPTTGVTFSRSMCHRLERWLKQASRLEIATAGWRFGIGMRNSIDSVCVARLTRALTYIAKRERPNDPLFMDAVSWIYQMMAEGPRDAVYSALCRIWISAPHSYVGRMARSDVHYLREEVSDTSGR